MLSSSLFKVFIEIVLIKESSVVRRLPLHTITRDPALVALLRDLRSVFCGWMSISSVINMYTYNIYICVRAHARY